MVDSLQWQHPAALDDLDGRAIGRNRNASQAARHRDGDAEIETTTDAKGAYRFELVVDQTEGFDPRVDDVRLEAWTVDRAPDGSDRFRVRFDRGFAIRGECKTIPRAPSEYLKRFTYDTISHSPDALRWLLALVGVERVMLGSDFCFDMGYERPRDIVTRQLGLKTPAQARILRGNAARLLRLR